jgi:hypothetical protein
MASPREFEPSCCLPPCLRVHYPPSAWRTPWPQTSAQRKAGGRPLARAPVLRGNTEANRCRYQPSAETQDASSRVGCPYRIERPFGGTSCWPAVAIHAHRRTDRTIRSEVSWRERSSSQPPPNPGSLNRQSFGHTQSTLRFLPHNTAQPCETRLVP